ncbi:MAG: DEAD/DEAH box helicase [Archaeoglobaceae archaeon]|nr:DEAD/DEAH box helicase [Archaeoglobaceae archaeon]MDW8118672.1 DEAD/DEAH box helicase [Archaeoglobaceae archaeon]
MLEDLFCPKCKRLKKRCICGGTVRDRNLELLKKNYKEFLKPIFDCDDEIVFYEVFQPFNESPTEPLDFLPLSFQKALRGRGIDKLYPFQKRAIELLRDGNNVVITAPTGFGKTEAFTIPMLEKAYDGKAMVFYPTKALAKDQEIKIKYYAESVGLKAVRFDGDSTAEERKAVLDGSADVVLTNPDMVDFHLRNTPSFRSFAKKIKFIALDELHIYTGFFGSNMHHLIKRLSRFADFQIACSSATLSNAKEFAEELFEREFVHVHGEHRKTPMNFIMRECRSIYSAILDVVRSFPKKKILIFGNSYKNVETVNWILRRAGINSAVHKGGLTKNARDNVEKDFREGKLKVVVATPTLELGIDIGDVDIVLSELVPYAQFLQRIGRAGRRGQESIGVLLLRSDDPISTFYKSRPQDYFTNEANGYVEKRNEEVMKFHALSMILEKLTKPKEVDLDLLNFLISEGYVKLGDFLSLTERGYSYIRSFSMRGAGERVKMVCNGEEIGERVMPIAIKELYPNALLIHEGKKFKCKELNLAELYAELEPIENEEITDPLYSSIPKVIKIEDSLKEPVNAVYTTLEITLSVYGYLKRDVFKERRSVHYLDEPVEYSYRTKGFLFSCPFPEYEDQEDFFAGSFHAVEHVLIESTNALTGGGSREIGGVSTPEGDVFIYDTTIGGNGLSKLLFKRLKRAFEISLQILENCDCKRSDGCPKCTYSYQCGNNNKPLSKNGAKEVIKLILSGERKDTDWKKYMEIAEFRYFP